MPYYCHQERLTLHLRYQKKNPRSSSPSFRLELMSLKRKCNFDRITSSSPTCPEDESSMTMKYIKTDEFFNENSHSSDEQLASPQSNSDEKKISSPVNRRKPIHSQLKHVQPPTSSSTTSSSSSSSSSNKTSISMILNLIESLVDEKQLEKNNDENLLLTIDCLISNLKYLREKIHTIHQDDTHPLNLSKPKVKTPMPHETSKSTTTLNNHFPMPSTIFPTQPFFPPFSGRTKRDFLTWIVNIRLSFSSCEYDTFTELFQTIRCIGSQ